MSGQHSLSFDSPAESLGEGQAVVLVTGAGRYGSAAADRLLQCALTDSGLAAHLPKRGDGAEDRVPPPVRSRSTPSALVVAFGADAARRLLCRPVSLALERGRVRALPDGRRVLVTEDPGAILRQSDRLARGRDYRRLVGELMLAVPRRARPADA